MPTAEVPSGTQLVPRRVNKKRGTTRERTGCLTCRQRKKRCDLAYPVCKECVRLNYMCKWEDPRPVNHDNTSSNPNTQLSRQSNSPFRLFVVPDPVLFWVDEHADCTSPSSRRHFLRYYTQTFTHLLTTNIENNSFLSVFLPMAMHSPPLLNTLIAWSSSHLSLRDDSFRHVAMQNRCAALSDLRGALQAGPVNMETNLAMSLVLCSLESIMADNGDAWYLHLAGAAGVISSNENIASHLNKSGSIPILQNFEDAHAGRWLLRNFAYRDIVMAVARDRAPLLNSHLFLQLDDARLPDSHFGLAFEILEIISETASLNEQLKGLAEPSALGDTLGAAQFEDNQNIQPTPLIVSPDPLTSLFALESRLLHWSCPQSPDVSLKLLAESYRGSALIYLYRVLRHSSPMEEEELSSKVLNQVAAVVSCIEQMPTRSLPECTLLFPLFLAGGEATTESHMKSIRHRMLDMIDSRGFKNVEVALTVLEKLWRLKIARRAANSSARVDWLDIVRQDGISLALS